VCRELKNVETSVLDTGSVVRLGTIKICLEDVEDDLGELKVKGWKQK
jgi:hypothetical protein